MVLLLTGASHTGKTLLAQKLLEKYSFPYLSEDHLKMGLIRSGLTSLTPEDDDELIPFLWNIVKEIVKTAVENGQNLIIEGCYIPFDYKAYFTESYLRDIKYVCLVFAEEYILRNYETIRRYESVIEARGNDEYPKQLIVRDNIGMLAGCEKYRNNYILIEEKYDIEDILSSVSSKLF